MVIEFVICSALEHFLASGMLLGFSVQTWNAGEKSHAITSTLKMMALTIAYSPPGERNDVYCASIEHKFGIKTNPTAGLIR